MVNANDKTALVQERAELITRLATASSHTDRIQIQASLSAVNAQLKALNTAEGIRLKTEADLRKAAGKAEAQANSARARANAGLPTPEVVSEPTELPDADAVDGWIDAVLLRNDIEFTRTQTGRLKLVVDSAWSGVVGMLIEGIYATAKGQALPELPSTAPKKPSKPKTKRRS